MDRPSPSHPVTLSRPARAARNLFCLLVLAIGLFIGNGGVRGAEERPELPNLQETDITLSWEDFKKLVEATVPPPPPVVAPPVAFALTRSAYEGTLEEGFARFSAEYRLRVFKENRWVQVPLVAGVALESARSEPAGVSFHPQGNRLTALARRPGTYALSLTFAVAAPDRPGANRLAFQIPPAASAVLRFRTRTDVTNVTLQGAVRTQTLRSGGRIEYRGAYPSAGAVQIGYHLPLPQIGPAAGTQVELEPKLYVETATLLSLEEELVKGQARFQYQVLHAGIRELRFRLPEGLEVLRCEGTGVQDWRLYQDGEARRLLVPINYKVEGDYTLVLHFEQAIPEGGAVSPVPEVLPEGMERESGFLGIEALSNLEVELNDLENIRAVDVQELPRWIVNRTSNPLLLGLTYHQPPFRAALRITRHEDLPVLVAAADAAHFTTLVTPEGHTLTRGVYDVKNSRKQFLNLRLPPAAELWSAFVRGKPVVAAAARDGRILIPLEKTAPGETVTSFPVEVVYAREGSPVRWLGTLTQELPRIDLPVSRVGLTLFLPAERRYWRIGGDLKRGPGARPVPGRGWGFLGGLMDLGERDAEVLAEPKRKKARSRGDVGKDGRIAVPASPAPAEEPEVRFYADQKAADTQFLTQARKGKLAPSVGTGMLPIRVELPEVGRRLTFAKYLVLEEAPAVRLLGVPVWALGVVWVVYLLLGGGIGWSLFRLALAAQAGDRPTLHRRSVLVLVLLLLDLGLGLSLRFAPTAPVALALVTLAVLGGLWLLRQRQDPTLNPSSADPE